MLHMWSSCTKRSFFPDVAPGSETQEGSVVAHAPSLTEASQYPLFCFHTSRMPSLSLFWTVVLTMTAPQDTQPPFEEVAVPVVVTAEPLSCIGSPPPPN